jgi:hypothetical protein
MKNYASSRSYPFTFTVSPEEANTWTYVTITIPGDTGGTWVGASNAGAALICFNFGTGSTYSGTAGAWASANYVAATGAVSIVGTNGATFYITGVQLEVGSVATPFERRQYGQELALCQRYLPAFSYASGANPYIAAGMVTSLSSSTTAWFTVALPVTTRVPPTGVTVSAASHFAAFLPSTATTNATGFTFGGATTTSANFNISGLSGTTAGYSTLLFMNTSSAYMYFTGCEL